MNNAADEKGKNCTDQINDNNQLRGRRQVSYLRHFMYLEKANDRAHLKRCCIYVGYTDGWWKHLEAFKRTTNTTKG